MSAQEPSRPPQPPNSEVFTAVRNTIRRKISEQAVADTPGTSGSYGSGGDYLECRKAPAGSARPSVSEGGGGIHGTDPRDYEPKGSGVPLRQNENVDADQVAPPAEGDVARVVETRSEADKPRWHGRTRGEVSLEGTEAHLERLVHWCQLVWWRWC